MIGYVLAACMSVSVIMLGSSACAVDSGAQASSENGNAKTDDGTPWIDSELKENISDDTPIDPKEDFHLYANKEWLMSNEIPDGYSTWSHYYEREADVKDQCLAILNDESARGHDAELIYTYYRLLLDWDERNRNGVSELQGTFDSILSAESLEDITAFLTDAEAPYRFTNCLIRIAAETGLNDPDRYLVELSLPKLLLEDSAEYSERTELGDMYYGLRKEIFTFIAGKLGMPKEDANSIFDAAIGLETKLSAEIYTTKETHQNDYLDRINHEMTYAELTSLSEVFPLDQILSASGYQYDGSYLVFSPDYIKLLDEIYTEKNLEDIKALLLVHYVYEYRTLLDRETYDKYNELQSEYMGINGNVPDEEMWAEGYDILTCNAFYSSDQNTINMIIGMMGEPFYSGDMSTEELYASIGAFWVGHEISHAFDSTGAMFDANGVYRDWWTSEDKEEFSKRVKKLDDYLDTIVAFDGRHFIGTSIDTEMIADMTGLQCALRMASKVPDFDYQKFFTKYAQMNGSIGLYSAELKQLLQDEHPLNYARTNVPVQQFDEFCETYDVKEGDAMYLAPEDRLLIW